MKTSIAVVLLATLVLGGCWRTEKMKEHRPPQGAEPTDYVPEERDPR